MKKLRILVLMHEDLVPPDSIEGLSDEEIANWKSEYDVCAGLEALGHDVYPLGVSDDLGVIRSAIRKRKPHIAFNLVEEFHGVAVYDQHVVSYLELIKQPYSGCNPRGLMLSHDKALCKQILSYHRIPTPRFMVFEKGKRVRRSRRVDFPLMVKSVNEEASMGISQKSIVWDEHQLADRVAYIHDQVRTDALAEEYIEGRELYVGLMGNQRLTAFPVWEMLFPKMPPGMARIATRRVKWDAATQKEYGIKTEAAKDLPNGVQKKIINLCKRVYPLPVDQRLRPHGPPAGRGWPGLPVGSKSEPQPGIRRRLGRKRRAGRHFLRNPAPSYSQPGVELQGGLARIER